MPHKNNQEMTYRQAIFAAQTLSTKTKDEVVVYADIDDNYVVEERHNYFGEDENIVASFENGSMIF